VRSDYLLELRDRLRLFARERDWEQFHTPKNLAAALSVEAAELLEHFQWSASPAADLTGTKRAEIGDEIADVLIYLVRFADVLAIDVESATEAKLAKNALKYPVELARGKSAKHSDL
jgi:dCTP diphosphatase